METIFIPHSDYLAHHGIKGQKWGVRRYQNEDGSYTAAGRERYSKALDKKVNKLQTKIFRDARKDSLGNSMRSNKKHSEAVRNKMFSDSDYKKANDEYTKAYADNQRLLEESYHKYGTAAVEKMPKNARKALVESEQRLNKATKNETESFKRILNKYEPELLSAALKDINEQDTELGREIIKEIYQGKRGSQWWLT